MQGTSQGPAGLGSVLIAMPPVPPITVAQETRHEKDSELESTIHLSLRPPGQTL